MRKLLSIGRPPVQHPIPMKKMRSPGCISHEAVTERNDLVRPSYTIYVANIGNTSYKQIETRQDAPAG